MILQTIILGTPTTKKNHSRFIRPGLILPSKPWCDYEKLALPQLKVAWGGREPHTLPVNLTAIIYRHKLTGDLVGYLQGICDLLEKAGVLENDRQVMGFDYSRLDHDKENPRVMITLTGMESVR